jgi:large subunit ribosomal protein L21
MPTYAIVKTGGKQYRVETGQTLLVEKLAVEEGATVTLQPLLFRGDEDVVTDGARLADVSVTATVLNHERGPKLRVFKFKPKRGYKRTAGHRQSLTRLQIAEVALSGTAPRKRAKKAETPKPAAADAPAADETKTGDDDGS